MHENFFRSLVGDAAVCRPFCLPFRLLAVAPFFALLWAGCASVSPDKASVSPSAAKISIVPSAVEFESVVVGQKNSQTLSVSNSSSIPISLQHFKISGAAFSLDPVKSPLLLAPGKQANLTVVFAPSTDAPLTGSLVITSSDLKAPVAVPLSGRGDKATPALAASPAAINFGTHAVKSSTSQLITLKNTGNIAVFIDSVGLSSSSFSVSGLDKGVSLAPNQKLEFHVWFHPTASGASSAAIAVATPALPAPLTIALSGSASASAPPADSGSSHSVNLEWAPSTSVVAGYHIYRSSSSGGPFSRITSSLIDALNYRDASVEAGAHYFYVVTAVGSNGAESVFSNEVGTSIPSS